MISEEEKINFFKEYKSIIIVTVAVVVVLIVVLLNFFLTKKTLVIDSALVPVTLKAGETYPITWKTSGISKVGIVLYQDGKASWIAKDLPAKSGSYKWKIFAYQVPAANYKIAVFEYPWKTGNVFRITDQTYEILGPKYSSCDKLGIENEWPYIPSDYENLIKVFITKSEWKGDLGGLEGADNKCQQEAQKLGYKGNYMAFLGDDRTSAEERLKDKGVYIEANPAYELLEGRTCHRLFAQNSQRFIEKFTLSSEVARIKLESEFMQKFVRLWVGQLTRNVKSSCIYISGTGSPSSYSYTTTCQNWSQSKEKIYQGDAPDFVEIERCYDESGKSIPANWLGAFGTNQDSSGNILFLGKKCNSNNSLLCVETLKP